MSTIKAVVNQSREIRSKITPQKNISVTKVVTGEGVNIQDLANVSADAAPDGSVLLYNETTGLWEATPIIENNNTTVNGGHY